VAQRTTGTARRPKPVTGILSALFTPYAKDGAVAYGVLDDLVDFQREAGLHGFYVCGTTGEGLLLTIEERMTILERVLSRVPASFPVIAHVGALTTRDACTLARHAAEVGAHAVSALPPLGLVFRPEDVVAHYAAVAEAGGIPFYAYHIPIISGNAAGSEALYAAIKDVPHLVGIKISSESVYAYASLKRLSGGKWNVLMGYDYVLLEGMTAGADGAIGSTYNIFPELNVKVWDCHRAGEVAKGARIQDRLRAVWGASDPLVSTRAGRYLLELRGFPMGAPRPPLQPLDTKEKALVRRTLKRLDLDPKTMT